MHGLPRGVLLNNPFNVKRSTIKWKGEVDSKDSVFAQFDTLEHGVRAGLKILISYSRLHGLNTIAQIIMRWAPEEDNNPTSNYIDFVAKHCGVDRNNQYNVCDPDNLLKLASAIIEFEQGSDGFVGPGMIKDEIVKLLRNQPNTL